MLFSRWIDRITELNLYVGLYASSLIQKLLNKAFLFSDVPFRYAPWKITAQFVTHLLSGIEFLGWCGIIDL